MASELDGFLRQSKQRQCLPKRPKASRKQLMEFPSFASLTHPEGWLGISRFLTALFSRSLLQHSPNNAALPLALANETAHRL